MIGIWTNKLGLDLIYSSLYLPSDNMICVLRRFHNAWEFWVYSVVYGLVVGPNYSISQTMMGELTPPGFEYMVGVALWSQAPVAHITQFFGLFGLSNRSASILGPNVIQVIVDKKGNNWKVFPVLFALSALGCLVAWFGINVPKGRLAATQWAAEKRAMGAGRVLLREKDGESSAESKSEDKSDGKF